MRPAQRTDITRTIQFMNLTRYLLQLIMVLVPVISQAQTGKFNIEEITISGLHAAIQNGDTTCKEVVQNYINRAKAYNGACTVLVTKDGGSIEQALGNMRTGSRVKFPTQTVAVNKVLPDLDKYEGLPLDLGRMEPTISDPNVQQQFGMRVGVPKAGQLNALEMLNIRGERSVSCQLECDKHPGRRGAWRKEVRDRIYRQRDRGEGPDDLQL